MVDSDSTVPPLAPKKDAMTSLGSKIAELNELRTELLSKIQGLKQHLQNWRSKLDTQGKIYRDDSSESKKSLNVEVEQLCSEFQELRSTLHQQQDVATSLKNLGLQDSLGDAKVVQYPKIEVKDDEMQALSEDSDKRAEN